MSETLEHRIENEYRKEIVQKLMQCTKRERAFFRRIFNRGGAEAASLDEIVNSINASDLSSVMALIERTLKDNREEEQP